MRRTPFKIVAGGQTGVDRAALDWAIDRGIRHGGWCPKGRRAEDGMVPRRYRLNSSCTTYSREAVCFFELVTGDESLWRALLDSGK